VVKDLKTWTWEPAVLLAARRDLGETIEAFAKRVSEKEMMAVRLGRFRAQTKRQRAMLKTRAAQARKESKQ